MHLPPAVQRLYVLTDEGNKRGVWQQPQRAPVRAQGKVLGFQRCHPQGTLEQYILKMCQISLKYSCMLSVIYRNKPSSIIILMLLPVKKSILFR